MTARPDCNDHVSPFEDPAVLARTTELFQRGYDRYLAAQRAAERQRAHEPHDDGDEVDGGDEAA